MGKRMDGFVCSVLLAAAFYFYFRGAFASRLLCGALAIASTLLIGKTFHMLLGRIREIKCFKKRSFRKKSGGILMQLACMEHSQACEEVQQLLDRSYNESYRLILLQQHPSLPLSQAKIFDTWHSNRDCEKLLICTTGKADASTRAFAESFSKPKIAVIDAHILSRLIADHPLEFPSEEHCQRHFRSRFRQAAGMLLRRRNAPRCFLLAFSMFIMYLFSANVFYLASSLILMFLTFAALRSAKKPRKLF